MGVADRMDTITVYLRAVSTKTGQVLASVTTHKTIASVAVQGGSFRYISVDKILEAEAGITKNEPDQLAVQQAIEKAVHTIIVQGADKGIWSFEDKDLQAELIRRNREESGQLTSAAFGQPDVEPQTTASMSSVKDTQTNTRTALAKPKQASGWGGTLMTIGPVNRQRTTGGTN